MADEKKDAQDVENLKRELAGAKALAEQWLTQLKYLQADFDNYRKFAERDKQQFAQVASAALVTELLPFLDSLHSAAEKAEHAEGFRTLLQQLLQILQKHGLKGIEAVGKRLDPHYHEAVAHAEGAEENVIISEVQKGYALNGVVIRHSKVVISKRGEQREEKEDVC
jgi:molecular chaperone GrpE